MPSGHQHRMQPAERRAARNGSFRDARHHLVEQVALVLDVPPDAFSRVLVLCVPGLAVDAVDADQLDGARVDPWRQHADHAEVLPLVETTLRGREDEQRPAARPETQELHVSTERMAVLACVLSVHQALLGDRKSTRLNSSHPSISYAVFCLKKKKPTN